MADPGDTPVSECGLPGTTVLLTRLARLVFRRSTTESLGMSLKTFATLAHLRDQSGISQQSLGEWLCLDPNNLVLLLNDLESAGLVVRRRDETDRRRHNVEITETGRRALSEAERRLDVVEDAVLGRLDASERSALRMLLGRALGEGATPVTDPVPADR